MKKNPRGSGGGGPEGLKGSGGSGSRGQLQKSRVLRFLRLWRFWVQNLRLGVSRGIHLRRKPCAAFDSHSSDNSAYAAYQITATVKAAADNLGYRSPIVCGHAPKASASTSAGIRDIHRLACNGMLLALLAHACHI